MSRTFKDLPEAVKSNRGWAIEYSKPKRKLKLSRKTRELLALRVELQDN